MSDTDDAARLQWLARRSVQIIRAGQSASGAYVASPSFAAYRFCWLRDGAFIADAMSRIGEATSAAAFLDWCARIIVDRRDRIRALLSDAYGLTRGSSSGSASRMRLMRSRISTGLRARWSARCSRRSS